MCWGHPAGKSATIGSKKLTLRRSTKAITKPLRYLQRGQLERRTIVDEASMKTPGGEQHGDEEQATSEEDCGEEPVIMRADPVTHDADEPYEGDPRHAGGPRRREAALCDARDRSRRVLWWSGCGPGASRGVRPGRRA
jgi:hypothetical protein